MYMCLMSEKPPFCKYTDMLVNGAISAIWWGMIMHILYIWMSYIQLLYFLVYGKVVVCHFHDKDINMIYSLILNMEVVFYVYDKPTNADI